MSRFDDLPELLGTLAAELAIALDKLQLDLDDAARDLLAHDLASEVRSKIGGHMLLSAPHCSAQQLLADPAYDIVYGVWREVLHRLNKPHAWVNAAALNLLETLREICGGQYICKGRSGVDVKALYNDFNGSYRETGLRHGLSAERVRQLINPYIQAERARRQMSLFDISDTPRK